MEETFTSSALILARESMRCLFRFHDKMRVTRIRHHILALRFYFHTMRTPHAGDILLGFYWPRREYTISASTTDDFGRIYYVKEAIIL